MWVQTKGMGSKQQKRLQETSSVTFHRKYQTNTKLLFSEGLLQKQEIAQTTHRNAKNLVLKRRRLIISEHSLWISQEICLSLFPIDRW